VVTSLVEDMFTPLIAMIFGEPDFAGLTFTINGAEFRYGESLNAVFALLSIGAATFFLVVKPTNVLMARPKAGEEPPPEAVAEDVVLLGEIRDLLRAQSAPWPSRPT
jgi:large conductance mechanosensitive channel